MENNNYKLGAWPAFKHGKCPRCRRGNIFIDSVFAPNGNVMNKVCRNCGLVFQITRGYYFVAVLISFFMNIAEIVIMAVAIHVLTRSLDLWLYFIITVCMAILLSPLTFRYSRIILLHWIMPGMRYDPAMSRDKTD